MKKTGMCDVTIVEVAKHTVTVEYHDRLGNRYFPDRRYISRTSIPDPKRNQPATIPCRLVSMGIPYTDVDLELNIGEHFGDNIRTRVLQGEMQRANLWMREDYRKNPGVVDRVLRQNGWRKYLDATTVLNAALRQIEGD